MAGNLLSSASDVTGSHDAIKHLKDDEDDAYISGYSHFSIHEEMLKVLKFLSCFDIVVFCISKSRFSDKQRDDV